MGVTTYKTKNGNFIIDSKKLNEKVTEVYKTYGFDRIYMNLKMR